MVFRFGERINQLRLQAWRAYQPAASLQADSPSATQMNASQLGAINASLKRQFTLIQAGTAAADADAVTAMLHP